MPDLGDSVAIVAVWSAVRGQGPSFTRAGPAAWSRAARRGSGRTPCPIPSTSSARGCVISAKWIVAHRLKSLEEEISVASWKPCDSDLDVVWHVDLPKADHIVPSQGETATGAIVARES